jgi:hypothetical protein
MLAQVIPEGLQLNYTVPVVYNDAAPFAEAGFLDAYEMFPDEKLVPIEVQPANGPADVTLNLTIYFETL